MFGCLEGYGLCHVEFPPLSLDVWKCIVPTLAVSTIKVPGMGE
jgi:hypothetical protein